MWSCLGKKLRAGPIDTLADPGDFSSAASNTLFVNASRPERPSGGGLSGPTGSGNGGAASSSDLETLVTQSAFVLAGLVSRVTLLMLFETVAARHLGPSGYGLFSLSFTVILVASALPCLGLQTALGRFIAYYREKGEIARLHGVQSLGYLWPATAGVGFAACVYLGAGSLAVRVFGKSEVAPLLRTLALVVPLWSARRLAVSIFSGYRRPLFKVAVEDLAEPLLRVGAALVVAMAGLDALGLGWGNVVAYLLVAVLAWVLIERCGRSVASTAVAAEVPWRELLAFSTPLVFSDLAEIILAWVDTLMLGIYSTDSQVGLFRSASQPPMLASAVLTSFAFIYLPTATRLFARKDQVGWKELNSVVARWTLSLSFPVAASCILFPEVITRILFGPGYLEGTSVMRILGVTYLIHAGVGFTGLNLVIAGHTGLQMVGKLISIFTHVGLNLLWIPRYGAAGAAAATLVSVVFSNAYNLVHIRLRLGILQFTGRYFALVAIHLASTAALTAGARLVGLSPLAGLVTLAVLELPLAVILAIGLGVITQTDRVLLEGIRARLSGRNEQ